MIPGRVAYRADGYTTRMLLYGKDEDDLLSIPARQPIPTSYLGCGQHVRAQGQFLRCRGFGYVQSPSDRMVDHESLKTPKPVERFSGISKDGIIRLAFILQSVIFYLSHLKYRTTTPSHKQPNDRPSGIPEPYHHYVLSL